MCVVNSFRRDHNGALTGNKINLKVINEMRAVSIVRLFYSLFNDYFNKENK